MTRDFLNHFSGGDTVNSDNERVGGYRGGKPASEMGRPVRVASASLTGPVAVPGRLVLKDLADDETAASIICGTCGEVLLRGPMTVPSTLLDHLKPCEREPEPIQRTGRVAPCPVCGDAIPSHVFHNCRSSREAK